MIVTYLLGTPRINTSLSGPVQGLLSRGVNPDSLEQMYHMIAVFNMLPSYILRYCGATYLQKLLRVNDSC